MTDTDCVFCDIVAGDAHALVVDEREGVDGRPGTLAFSPLDPVAPGHVLVIPRAHHESLFDVPADALTAVTEHARSLARRMRGGERGFDGANLLNDSTSYQSVPHLHLHVVGRREDDPDLFPETDYDREREDAYDAVTDALESGRDSDSTASERESVK
jgi:histidine triad (HIT) family protein